MDSNEKTQDPKPSEEEEESEEEKLSSSSSSSSSEYDSDDSSDSDDYNNYQAEGEEGDSEKEEDDSPETNIRRFTEALQSKKVRKQMEEEDRDYVFYEDLFDFPKDPENWREEDLMEIWADAPIEMTKPGWDPVWADVEDWKIVLNEMKEGRDPEIAPFYVPYRKHFPAIPDNHFDIATPKAVVEEMDRIEEFLQWVSYIFADGSSYEGTVWDDLAHGKGVYVSDEGLVRYEGEWLQNNMEGHGVVEVDVPDVEPIPGSKLEAKMRAQGKIISRDFLPPEDKKWLEMDIEDSVLLAGGAREIPFYEHDAWIKIFGEKPEKGRYKYAGQWKHSRMHGCGVYEVNERIIYGRFYFGELLQDSSGCDADVSAMHAGIAEVAAAKARMFVNKPDGMVREERGPYGDPQHPYLYEEEDAWMAPGFINQFYEVPDYWKTYAHEVDQEREMWLNSFYKAPLRLPMPAELEYWWENDETPEFILINKEPEPDPDDPSKLVYTEDPLILHTPSGRLINYVDDEEHGVRLFWQPPLKEGEDVDPEKAVFLPLGYDEFFGRAVPGEKKEGKLKQWLTSLENKLMPMFDRLEKWGEEKKKQSEIKNEIFEMELELKEAELCLEEQMKELDMLLKMKQKEEEKKAAMGQIDEENASASVQEKLLDSDEEDVEEEGEEPPTSFGSVIGEEDKKDATKGDKNGKNPGMSPFATSSLSFACNISLLESFLSWKNGRKWPVTAKSCDHSSLKSSAGPETVNSLHFPHSVGPQASLRAAQARRRYHRGNGRLSQLHSLARILCSSQSSTRMKRSSSVERSRGHHGGVKNHLNILSMHVPIAHLESCIDAFT
eukprot:TRINITY_DN18298_c0_g1_i2.p1 TRINITY_DN18298_c0_g1~~TRINITY_DN18298_c0_g1_i2.p1  ORF type:complete len:895 (+),score=213.76 TRINITY_DN18298_c0_g1_i2:189-2687(+)